MRPLRVLVGLALVAVAGVGACRLFMPERLAVNAPLGSILFGWGGDPLGDEALERHIRVAEGFSIGLYAEVPGARMLRFTDAGDLLVSRPRAGEIVRVAADRDGDGRGDGVSTLLAGLNRPHGLDLHDGWLYVAETDAVGRVRFDGSSVVGEFERIAELPGGGGHWTRTLRFGPDGWLYVSIGSTCNACEEEEPRRASLLRMRADGSEASIHAAGLRNAVGFAWRPGTDELYATDNGRDLLGDDFPPCELNRIVRGGFYGWPHANGARVPDPDHGAGHENEIATSIPPVHGFRPHNAPLGLLFPQHASLPPGFRNAALVALHGSWNRTAKDGYEVVSVHFGPGGRTEERPFVWGFLEDEAVRGRPVDLAEGPDGGIYLSDDYAGAIYRVNVGSEPLRAPSRSVLRAPTPGAAPPAPPVDAETLARGRALRRELACASCHDPARAEPGVVAVPLQDLGARYDLDGLAAFLSAPTPPMPAVDRPLADRLALAAAVLAEGVKAE